jgi:hypothetical protein
MFPLSGRLFQYQESQIQIPLGSGHLCGIPRDILDKGLPISDNPLYNSRSLYYEIMFRASFGIVLSIGAVLFAIWPHILPLQQHLAMAQVVPGSAPPANTTAGVPANTTAGVPANTTAGVPPSEYGLLFYPANTTAGVPANTTAGVPANTTAGVPANTTAALPRH